MPTHPISVFAYLMAFEFTRCTCAALSEGADLLKCHLSSKQRFSPVWELATSLGGPAVGGARASCEMSKFPVLFSLDC